MATQAESSKASEKHLLEPKVEEEGSKAVYDALTPEERLHLADDTMCLRHFRAEKGDTKKAIAKIKATLKWREEFRVKSIVDCFNQENNEEMQNTIARHNETGKIYIGTAYDCDGRATMLMRPNRENYPKDVEGQMQHLVYQLERARACTTRKSGGLEKFNLMIDFDGTLYMPPISVSKQTVNILQNHYPETLFKAYVCNPPFSFRAFWTIIKPFLDPVTKEKIIFCYGDEGVKQVAKRFNLDLVEKCGAGKDGKLVKKFDSKDYIRSTPFDHSFAELDPEIKDVDLSPTGEASTESTETNANGTEKDDDETKPKSKSMFSGFF